MRRYSLSLLTILILSTVQWVPVAWAQSQSSAAGHWESGINIRSHEPEASATTAPGTSFNPAADSTPKPGEAAPAFSLPTATGSSVALKDYTGKSKLVLVFYRGYW